jgi:hypothetical protein
MSATQAIGVAEVEFDVPHLLRFALRPLPQAGEVKKSSLLPLAGEGGSRGARDG